MIHQQDQRTPPLGGELEPRGDLLREQCAGLRVVARARRLAGVVEQQRQVEDERVGEIFEQLPVVGELRVAGFEQRVEFFDADEGVFVGRIPVEKLVLHEAGQFAELRQVGAEQIHLVHRAQDAPDLSAPGEDRDERFPRRARVLERPVHQPEPAADELLQLGAEGAARGSARARTPAAAGRGPG